MHQPIIHYSPMPLGRRPQKGMKIDVYQQLLRIQTGYDQVITALGALRQYPLFKRHELERLGALSKEIRADTNSYLAGAIETAETAEAGRRYRRRRLTAEQEERS